MPNIGIREQQLQVFCLLEVLAIGELMRSNRLKLQDVKAIGNTIRITAVTPHHTSPWPCDWIFHAVAA